jgi:hypothetical protein
MRTLINLILMASIVVATCWGCSYKSFSGQISHVSGDTVVCKGRMIKVEGNVPKVGQKVVFITTRDKRKVNCKIIN